VEPRDARQWPPGRVVKVTATVLVVVGLARAIVAARVPLLVIFLAIVLSTLFSFPIDWIARRWPKKVAIAITVVALAGVLAGIGFWVAPTLRGQLEGLPDKIAAATDQLQQWLQSSGIDTTKVSVAEATAKSITKAVPVASRALEIVFGLLFVIVLAFFLAAGSDGIRGGLRRLLPLRHHPDFDTWWSRVGTTLRRWTGGIVVSMMIMGIVSGVGLWIAGISSPLLLGVLTFLGTFVPYVGAIASAIPGLAIALAQSPRHFWYALVVYVVVHHVEGYFVQPFIMRRAVELKPAVLLCWEAIASAVFGIPGLIVATPLLACLHATVQCLWVERLERLEREPPA
jgi:predicted PurR-regulated permease PerM